MRCSFALLSTLASASSVVAATWTLSDNYVGTDFLSAPRGSGAFTHENIADPTNGRVNYVDETTALEEGLTYANSSTLILRADSTTVLSSTGLGRNSVRIRSVKTYTQHVAVFDIGHMPEGCGTWPAAWETTEAGWPAYGEVDILEGVNNVSPNQATLHTSPGCTMPTRTSTQQTGTSQDSNCNGGSGCGVTLTAASTANNYGPAFNANGGGWYVMQRTASDISIWFWPRNGAVPDSVSMGEGTIDTSTFGTPAAYFPTSSSCDLNSEFGSNNIIINLTFCGDWAGQAGVYSSSGCPGTCADYVNRNPSAFSNAYWNIAAVRVYE